MRLASYSFLFLRTVQIILRTHLTYKASIDSRAKSETALFLFEPVLVFTEINRMWRTRHWLLH